MAPDPSGYHPVVHLPPASTAVTRTWSFKLLCFWCISIRGVAWIWRWNDPMNNPRLQSHRDGERIVCSRDGDGASVVRGINKEGIIFQGCSSIIWASTIALLVDIVGGRITQSEVTRPGNNFVPGTSASENYWSHEDSSLPHLTLRWHL